MTSSFFAQFLDDALMASGLTGFQVSVILSQWADETNYGATLSHPDHLWNFAGISPGGSVTNYPSEQAGLNAYIECANQSYYNAVRQAKGYKAQAYALGSSPWAASKYDATDYYAGKPLIPGVDLVRIVETNNLTALDPQGTNTVSKSQGYPPTGAPNASPATTDNSKSPVGSLGPPQHPPPPGIESSVAKNSFTINGSQFDVDISHALTTAGISLDITQASTLTLTMQDPQRIIINNPTFNERSVLNLGGDLYELAAVEKQDNVDTVTFEPWVIAALRKATGAFSIQPGTMTRTEFAGLLVNDVIDALFVSAPQTYLYSLDMGYGQAIGLQEQLSRGTVDLSLESSWTCLQRIASEIGWRCFCVRSAVYFGPDSWLMTQPPVLSIREFKNGIQEINGTWDIGQPLASLTVNAVAGSWFPNPGQVVTVNDLGPFSTNWLVQTVDRPNLFQPDITITLCRPQPSLHEPVSGGAAAATSQQSTAGSTTAQAALAAAVTQIGKPYVSGGENPNSGFDCSGLMQWAYGQAGLSISRTSEAQQAAGPAVPIGVANLLPGDLVFFGPTGVPATHVAMVVSTNVGLNTVQMIQSSHPGAPIGYATFTPDIGSVWGNDIYQGASRPAA